MSAIVKRENLNQPNERITVECPQCKQKYSISPATRAYLEKCSECGRSFSLDEICDEWDEQKILKDALVPFLGGSS
jgi:peptide subunit release factor 1 (eRF1)